MRDRSLPQVPASDEVASSANLERVRPAESRRTGVGPARTEPGSIVRAVAKTDAFMVFVAVTVALVAGWGAGDSILRDPARQSLTVAVLITWPLVLWQRQTRVSSILGAGGEEYRRVLVASGWVTGQVLNSCSSQIAVATIGRRRAAL